VANYQYHKDLLASMHVCGIAFVTPDHKLKILQGTKLYHHIEKDGMPDGAYIVGQVGNATTPPQPASLPMTDLLKDLFTYVKVNQTTPPTWLIVAKKPIQEWTPKEGEMAIQLPTNWKYICGTCPRCLPTSLWAQTTSRIPLINPLIKKAVVDYHPSLCGWIDAIDLQVAYQPNQPQTSSTWAQTFYQKFPSTLPLQNVAFPSTTLQRSATMMKMKKKDMKLFFIN
jgi:hypothetical protein